MLHVQRMSGFKVSPTEALEQWQLPLKIRIVMW